MSLNAGLVALAMGFALVGQGMAQDVDAIAREMKPEVTEAWELYADRVKMGLISDKETCEQAKKTLGVLAQSGETNAFVLRFEVVLTLACCAFQKQDYAEMVKWAESAIGEHPMREEQMLKQHGFSHVPLMKDTAKALKAGNLAKASVALRRALRVTQRVWGLQLKNIAKQNNIPPGPKQEEVILPNIKKFYPPMRIYSLREHLGKMVKALDDMIVLTAGGEVKTRRATLGHFYYPGLFAPATLPAKHMSSATALQEAYATIRDEVKEAALKKSAQLTKRTLDGPDCTKLPKTCELVKEQWETGTNGFGSARVQQFKAGKKANVATCETSANVLLFMPLDHDATIHHGRGAGKAEDREPVAVAKGTLLIVDSCASVVVEAKEGAQVLMVDAWHPEVSSIERSAEMRDRSQQWNWGEDLVKKVTGAINKGASQFDKSAKMWWEGNAFVDDVTSKWKESSAAKAANEEAKKLQAENEARSETAEEGKDVLEAKRAEKAKKEAELEEKRKATQAKLQAERAKQLEAEPWLADPAVVELKEELDSLKQQRRDANTALEFDLTTKLTKQINDKERQLKKVTKKAKKEHKKAQKEKEGGAATGAAGEKKEL